VKVIIPHNFDNSIWHYLENDSEDQLTAIPEIEVDQIPYWNKGELLPGQRIVRTTKNVMRALQLIEKYGNNLFLLLEEAGKYFDDGRLPTFMKALIIDSKQKNVDSLLVFHYLNEVPPKIAVHIDYLYLKKTGEDYSDVKSKFKHPKLKQIMELIESSPNKYIPATLYVGP